jgi:small subunit ribosomal protein S16
MLAIRLRRAGSTRRPFFRVVVTESSAPREGRFVEVIGHYNPRTQPETLHLERERLEHWMKAGAQPSDTLRTLVDRMPPPAPAGEAPQVAVATPVARPVAAPAPAPEPLAVPEDEPAAAPSAEAGPEQA